MSAVQIQGNASGTGTLTIAAPNTNTNQTLTLPDQTGTFMVNGPAFSAYLGTTQSITTSVYTKISINTEEFDTNNNYDNATNYRFTPTVAGYYQINSQLACSATAGTIYAIVLYKNGSAFKNGNDLRATSGSNNIVLSTVVYMNGSTDYLEIYVYITGTSPSVIGGSATNSYFQGFLARGA